jgi:hypothetical protein
MTTTKAPWLIRVKNPEERPTVPSGEADDIHSALDAAWALQRHTEAPVEVYDNRDDTPRLMCTVTVEWAEG